MDVEQRKAVLQGYIDKTRRLQRKYAILMSALGAGAIGLMFWNSTIGSLAVVFVGAIAGIGFWVTAAHILEHRGKIAELDRLERMRKNPPPAKGGHRRWQVREPD